MQQFIEEQIEALTQLPDFKPKFNDNNIECGYDAIATLAGFEGIAYAKSTYSAFRTRANELRLHATIDLYENIIKALLQEKYGLNRK